MCWPTINCCSSYVWHRFSTGQEKLSENVRTFRAGNNITSRRSLGGRVIKKPEAIKSTTKWTWTTLWTIGWMVELILHTGVCVYPAGWRVRPNHGCICPEQRCLWGERRVCSLLFSDTIDVLFTVHNSGTIYTYRACRIVGTRVRKSFVFRHCTTILLLV